MPGQTMMTLTPVKDGVVDPDWILIGALWIRIRIPTTNPDPHM